MSARMNYVFASLHVAVAMLCTAAIAVTAREDGGLSGGLMMAAFVLGNMWCAGDRFACAREAEESARIRRDLETWPGPERICEGCDGTGGPSRSCAGCGGTGVFSR